MELGDEHIALTDRELEILALVADGLSAKEIAAKMQLSPRTIERHVENCKFKLHARNTSQLILKASTSGYLSAMTRAD